MKKVIRLTESQLENIIRKVIAEQEDYAPPGGWNKEQLQYHEQEAKKLFSSVKPEMGGKFCFSIKQDPNSVMEELKRSVRTSGSKGKSLYKIKNGDTPDSIKSMAPNYDVEGVNSKSCNMDKPRIGDVIIIQR